jgi:hypothetical protein
MNMALRVSLWVLAAALAIPILLLGAYFFHGSFEMFPTDEQQSKVRLVSGIGILIFTVLEALVVFALLHRRKSNTGPTPTHPSP